jgi:putative peptide zinc metalloprotease protein
MPAPPVRADGVRLMGEMPGSGYREPPALARRADGQVVQLTPLLYALLAELDGRRSHPELAAAVSATTGRSVSAENVGQLVDKLRRLGLVASPDGAEPDLRRSNPLLALRFKAVVSDPERTRRLTAPFARLFSPLLVAAVVAVFAWITWWVLFERGLASATHDAFARPRLLLAVLAVTVLSAGFHEFGHAAAARRGGSTPGAMGVGLYLIWPAFYTDVTDSYRLGRAGRLRTDLGGLYFNALVVVATAVAWWVSGYDALLLLVATQVLQMLHQLLPLVRFDGYHVLADLTGVPDLFQRIGPTLRGLLPWHWHDRETRILKPWARAVVAVWVLTVVPVLGFTLFLLVTTFPRIVGSAWTSSRLQWAQLTAAAESGDLVAAVARGLAALIVLLPPLAMAVALGRLARRAGQAVWTRTAGRPVRRAVAVLASVALLAGLMWSWWPSPGRYRPVQAYEGGTLTQALPLARPAAGLAAGSQGRAAMYLSAGQAAPTREKPALALVLVPHGTGSASGQTGGAAPATKPATWVFPVDQPLAPGKGDNQALAVNTADGTVVYDVAFALVWEDGSGTVDNTNEAYALASCRGCAAVAVAFQVVLVTGQADVAVPQNVSVAVTSGCVGCLTYALAVQLFVTLDGPLSAEAKHEVEQLWSEIAAFGADLQDVPLDEIRTRLTDYESQLLAVLHEDGVVTTAPSASAEATATAEAAGPSPSGDAPDVPTDAVDPSGSPTDAVDGSPGASGAPTQSAYPSDTGSSEPAAPTATTSPAGAGTAPAQLPAS